MEKKVCWDGNSYLTNLQEAWEKKRMTSTTKIQALNLQKFVVARGEYQTTRYSASKRLNTAKGMKYGYSYHPQPNLHNYNLH